MQDDEARGRSRGRSTAAQVRSVGHAASGGHSPYRFRREPNDIHHHGRKPMAYEHQEYPKWLHFEGEPSVLVGSLAEEEAVLGAREADTADDGEDAPLEANAEAPKRRGRPPKAPVTQAE